MSRLYLIAIRAMFVSYIGYTYNILILLLLEVKINFEFKKGV